MKRRKTISKYHKEKLGMSGDSKIKNETKRKITSMLAASMFVNAMNNGGYTNDI